MARTNRTKPTWQEYLRRTAVTRAPGTDAAFGNRPLTTATQLRWAGRHRLLFEDRIITGKYTGRKLDSLTPDQLHTLLTKATHQADHDAIAKHIATTMGPQPGAPVDPETLHSGGTIQVPDSPLSIVSHTTSEASGISETSTKE